MRKLLRSDWFWLFLAAALRAAFAIKLGDRFYQIDEGGFDGGAWSLASTGTLGLHGVAGALPPIPNGFIAFFYVLLGHDKLYPRLAMALVGTVSVWLVGRMTRELTRSDGAGRLALALSAVYPFFIYYSAMLLSETLYTAFVVAGLWWLCQDLIERGRTIWRAPLAGLAWSLAALTRTEGAPIAAVIWAAAFFACLSGRWPWRAWVLAVLCWAIPLMGWGLRNWSSTGNFALDNHGGMAMLHGTLLLDWNEQDTAVAMDALKKMPFYQQSQSLTPKEQDRLFMRESLEFMRENPGTTLKQWARKLVNFWRFYPRTDKAYIETATSHPGVGAGRAALVAVSLMFEPWLILGGLAGLWTLRDRWRELFPLGLFLFCSMGIHMVSVSQMRYRLPVMPILILGACALAASFLAPDRREI